MSKPDAIQPDVSATADQHKEPAVHPREAAMRDIMNARLKTFSVESGVEVVSSLAGDADVDPADAAAEAERARLAADDTGKEPVVEKPQPDQLDLQTNEPSKVKVKIDGVEEEVTPEEIRQYQKGRTADRRLEEAARRQRELDAREAELALQAAAPPAKAAPAVDAAEITKQFTTALFEGDEEKAAECFQTAVQSAVEKATNGRGDATHVDIDQITATVEQRFAVNSALKKSRDDYPDLYADPDIEALAAMKIRAKREDGLSFAEALEETGKEFATKFGWKQAGRQTPAQSTTREEKLNRKEAIDPIVGNGAKSSTTEAPPMSHSQVIAQMAARRPGQGL